LEKKFDRATNRSRRREGTDFGFAKIRLREEWSEAERRRDPVPNLYEFAKISGLDRLPVQILTKTFFQNVRPTKTTKTSTMSVRPKQSFGLGSFGLGKNLFGLR